MSQETMDLPPFIEVEELTSEQVEQLRSEKLDAMAREVINGTRTTIRLEAKYGETDIWINVRKPTMDDDDVIESLAAAYVRGGISFGQLPYRKQRLNRARAFFEVCAMPEYPSWVPLSKEPIEFKGTKAKRPDFREMDSAYREYLELLFEAYEEVESRFRR